MAMAQILPLRLPDAPPRDGALVERALTGEEWAKRELFQRHAPAVLGLLTRLLASTADAEDAAQDTFVEAFRDLLELRERDDFGRWVKRIAVHQAHRRFRRRKWMTLFGNGPELDATFEAIVDERVSPERHAELLLIDKTLRGLPTVERAAWLLRHVEEFELTEVAQALGISLATVKRKLSSVEAQLARVTGVPHE
jgi:RNA polymerase sigma-70 factor (ECF subfamily)